MRPKLITVAACRFAYHQRTLATEPGSFCVSASVILSHSRQLARAVLSQSRVIFQCPRIVDYPSNVSLKAARDDGELLGGGPILETGFKTMVRVTATSDAFVKFRELVLSQTLSHAARSTTPAGTSPAVARYAGLTGAPDESGSVRAPCRNRWPRPRWISEIVLLIH
jgi:hypothetical protein